MMRVAANSDSVVPCDLCGECCSGATTENTERHRGGMGGELVAGDGLAGEATGYHRVGFYWVGVVFG